MLYMAPSALTTLAVVLLVLRASDGSARAVSEPVPVFTWGEEGYPVFREPAILLLPSGNLLAFIEGGQNHLAVSDGYPNANSDVVSKMSSDGGATWGKLSVVLKNSSQPGAVWDSVHKQVVLNLNGAPHCMDYVSHASSCGFNLQMTSSDGLTWSAPKALDGFLGTQGHAAAGHAGLELQRGPHKGRLLFIGHRGAYVEDAVWYTDDGGTTYKTSTHTLPKMDEAQLVENRNGTLIANMRWRGSSKQGRGVATSTDSGVTFSAIAYDKDLKTPVCQATIWQSPQNEDIYYAAPSSELDGVLPFGRTHGTVRRSKTGLLGSWQKQHIDVTNASKAFGYSCLTDVPQKGKGGLLWESVRATVFSTFDLEF